MLAEISIYLSIYLIFPMNNQPFLPIFNFFYRTVFIEYVSFINIEYMYIDFFYRILYILALLTPPPLPRLFLSYICIEVNYFSQISNLRKFYPLKPDLNIRIYSCPFT